MEHRKHADHLSKSVILQITGLSAGKFDAIMNSENPIPKVSHGKYSVPGFGEWYRGYLRNQIVPMLPGSTVGDDGGPTLLHEKKRKTSADADRVERENAVAEGLLVKIDEVTRGWTIILSRVKARLLRVPSVVAPLVLGLTDQAKIETTVDDQIRDALLELSADWQEVGDE